MFCQQICNGLKRIQFAHQHEAELVHLLNPHRLHLHVLLCALVQDFVMALALLLSVQTSILNFRAVWCSSRCFTYRASIQPFVIALASDSADDSDTVACVTDQ